MARVPTLFSPGSLLGVGGSDPFLVLHREMNRLFDDALRGGGVPSGGQGGHQSGALLIPHMDVGETDKEVRIQVELPGIAERDVEVSLNEDMLTIRAEKKQDRKEEREGVHFSERVFGTFQRSLRLPFLVDADQVQARFENGVLSVTLPKTQQQARSRRIQIQGASEQAGSGAEKSGQAGQAAGLQVGDPASSGNGSSRPSSPN